MSPLEVHNPGFHDLIAPEAPIERIAGGLGFTEGPVWRGTDLLFSDIPNKRIVRWRRLPEACMRVCCSHSRPGPGASGWA